MKEGIGKVQAGVSRLTDSDIYLFREGSHFRLYDKMGSHLMEVDGKAGTLFSVWAPNAVSISVIGDFNDWTQRLIRLPKGGTGPAYGRALYQASGTATSINTISSPLTINTRSIKGILTPLAGRSRRRQLR